MGNGERKKGKVRAHGGPWAVLVTQACYDEAEGCGMIGMGTVSIG